MPTTRSQASRTKKFKRSGFQATDAKRKPRKGFPLVVSVNEMLRELAHVKNRTKIAKESYKTLPTGKRSTRRTSSKTALDIMKKYYPKPADKTSDVSIMLQHYTSHQSKDQKTREEALQYIKPILMAQHDNSTTKIDTVANRMSDFNKALGREFQQTSKITLTKTDEEWKLSRENREASLLKATTDQIDLPIETFFSVVRRNAKDLSNTASVKTRSQAIMVVEACTGVRHVGVVGGQITWTDTKRPYSDGTVRLLQHGRRKDKKGETAFDASYRVEKPLLAISFEQFQRAVKVIAYHRAIWMRTNKPQQNKDKYLRLSSSWTTTTNKHIRSQFPMIKSEKRKADMTSHRLRASYATIAVKRYRPKGQAPTLTINRWLGQQDNSSVATHYETINITFGEADGGGRLEQKIGELATVDNVQQESIDTLVDEVKALKAVEPTVEAKTEQKDYVIVKGSRIPKNPKQRGKTLENAKKAVELYKKITGENPTSHWLRTELGYGGNTTSKLNL